MNLRMKDPHLMIMIGMVCLIAFNVSNFIVRRWIGGSWQDLLDGVSGVALGAAAAFILFAARLKGRQRRGDEASPCA